MSAKIELIDTHAHIYSSNLLEEISAVIDRSQSEGVTQIYMPNIDSNSIESMLQVEADFQHCQSMMGLHPCSVKDNYKDELALVKEWLTKRSFAAIGEIGIDLYWDKTFADEQFDAFEYQIHLSKEYDIPFVIHSREALDLTIAKVSDLQDGNLRGIFHCFNGTIDQGKAILDLGFYLGIGGVLTYKNSGVADTVAQLPISGMVLETDSPYLAPVPKRGKPNEPSFLAYICQKLADVKEMSFQEVALITTKNAKNIFE